MHIMKTNKLFTTIILLFAISLMGNAQSKIISPNRFVKIEQQKDKLHMDCAEGFAELTFYSENIVHFAYYPTYNNKTLPGWGILPSQKIVDVDYNITHGGRDHHFKSKNVDVHIIPIEGKIAFLDVNGNKFLETAEMMMKSNIIHGEKSYATTLSFEAPDDEHYFGLGQHQNGWLDYKGKVVPMAHDYETKEGEVIAIPFMLTNKNYALVYDNPSKSTVACGVNGKTTWISEMGDAISFYVIYGNTTAEIYKSYGKLCGFAPLPPKKSLGYIQCKQKYNTQDEVLNVARKYREKGYPIDYMIVDWFHWSHLGDLDMNTDRWPDATAMNKELKSMNINCMISCWPRFTKESKNFDILNKRGWLMRDNQGNTVYGTAWDDRGALIDNTNPEAAAWYWNTINKNYNSKGFDSYWLDESEPDIIPHNYYLHAGLGARVYNIYPYCHAKGIYTGHRKDLDDRVFVLTRSGYLGTQQFGTTFWSSDIFPEWDVLERQIACGVNFCASGMPYWSSDIGGWQGFQKDRVAPKVNYLLTSMKGPKGMNYNYPDYPEMYVRWFQYGAFCPTFRAHGTRSENEVWSYGEKAETILVDYLKLRYNLMPYIYSQAYNAYANNMPWMRGLFLDFMKDEKVMDIHDEYLFGPSILVAPVVKPGKTSREVYIPKGSDWFDFWSNKKISGGTTVKAQSPIDIIPLYIKAGTILPKANDLKFATQKLDKMDLYIYPGANAEFVLYDDNGSNYDYEKGAFATVKIFWDDANKVLTINSREGVFEGLVKTIEFNVVLAGDKVNIYSNTVNGKKVIYRGEKLKTVCLKYVII